MRDSGKRNIGDGNVLKMRRKKTINKLSKSIENSGDIIINTDRNGIITYVNKSFCEFYGYRKEDMVGKVTPRILKSGNHTENFYNSYWSTLLQKKRVKGFQFTNKCKNGKIVHVEVSADSILDDSKEIIGFLAIQRDVTQRVRNENAQNVILNIANLSQTTSDIGQLMKYIQTELGKVVDTTNFYVALYNEETVSFDLPYYTNEKDHINSFPAGKTLTSLVIKKQRSLLLKEVEIDKLIKQNIIDDIGFNSKVWLGVPLKVKNKITGVFVVQSYVHEEAYTIEDLHILEIISNQISITVERNLYEKRLLKALETSKSTQLQLQKQNEEIILNNNRIESLYRVSQLQVNSTQELLDYALHEAIKLTSSKIGYIYFYNEESKQFTLNTWSKDVMNECSVMNPLTLYDLENTGIWGEAVRQRKPIMVNNFLAENDLKKGTPNGHVMLTKFLTIPVICENTIVAVIGVANKVVDYDNSDIRQLSLLMDNVWKVSERTILIDKLKSAKVKAEESDRLKSAFLANMSHEIRTPMNAVLGFAELLKSPNLSGDKQKKYIDIITKSGNRLLKTISDIVDISRIEAGHLQVNNRFIDIHKTLKDILTIFQQNLLEKNLQIKVNCSLLETQSNIYTDSLKIHTILENLIMNAIKFTHKGFIEINCCLKNEELLVTIKDTGIGIPISRQSAVFDRFIQSDIEDKEVYEGSGLGLAIAKSYVEILGGKLWLKSKVGVGSTFFFTIPYKTA
ncbi:MAG: GAF domain-containing protein [Lutibacter sp.]|uniref:GAF domain-containing protein n=1 Tax=Lutibacter sp. TaxID=1925666 RepID=UPI001801C939|nr:GAF domain-containing protein [Lutibacter sp.]MBT8318322.1 GAF domain-containing protein [Lutibacter sp.]NNJ59180.1 GAF domain-containing protein [Lutibacter sp.]